MVELEQFSGAQPTGVGSYFIANYPPFSAWKPEHVPAVLAALDAPAAATGGGLPAPLGLYLHIPFCRKRCKFCYFRVYTEKNAGEIDAYVDALAREIELYARRPALAGRQFEFVYFGGGTPSYLSSGQLLGLIERINRHWRWDAAREVTFECEPGTLQKGKLETIRRIGTTRLSLGIEHFDDEVLAINGRAHKSAEIFRAWAWAREVGFPQINIDLIAGMAGDDENRWKAAVERAVALAPDSVTIYQMELPHNTIFTREVIEGSAPPPLADWATKRRWTAYAFEQFEKAGYAVSSAYTLVRPASHAGFVYRDSLWHGADMIGTGVASFSHVAGVHFQNADTWEGYVRPPARGELPIARALPVSQHSRMIRELVLQLKTGRVVTEYFRDKFGVDILDAFREAVDGLCAEGFVASVDGALVLSREGLLCVDALLPRFFERKYRGLRYT